MNPTVTLLKHSLVPEKPSSQNRPPSTTTSLMTKDTPVSYQHMAKVAVPTSLSSSDRRDAPDTELPALTTSSLPSTVSSSSSSSSLSSAGNPHNHGSTTGGMTPDLMLEMDIDDAIEQIGMGVFQNRILWAAGLCFAADSMEVLLLSFLAIVLQVEWDLTDQQTAAIVSSVFIGALMGSLILGTAGDLYGRKPVFLFTAGMISVVGLMTAGATTYSALLFTRTLVGFGVGGLTVPFDTLAEFVPTSHRGRNLLAIDYFWTAGSVLVPFLAYLTFGDDDVQHSDRDWRIFVVLCSIPCFVSTVIGCIYVPESPRWLLTKGRHEEALDILRRAAIVNGKNDLEVFPPNTRLADPHVTHHQDSTVWDLWTPKWRNTTAHLWISWFGLSLLYYGTILATTRAFSESSNDSHSTGSDAAVEAVDGGYSFDYGAIVASSSSELAGTTLAIFLVDRAGRIRTQSTAYLLGGISVFGLCVSEQRAWQLLAAFGARLCFMVATCTTWVSTAEILTTNIRSSGHSYANAMGRLGGCVSPYIVTKTTPFPWIGTVLLLCSVMTFWSTSHLPETRGKSMGVGDEADSSLTQKDGKQYAIVE